MESTNNHNTAACLFKEKIQNGQILIHGQYQYGVLKYKVYVYDP